MNNYLKKLESHSAYTTFAESNDYITPNVIYDTEHVHYNPYVNPIIYPINAQIGDILWSDLTVTSTVRPTTDNVIPIGICVITANDINANDGKSRFMALKYATSSGSNLTGADIKWATSSYQSTLIPNVNTGDEYKYTDYSGLSNTQAILTYNRDGHPSTKACANYNTIGTQVGEWYLGATQEVFAIFNNRSIVESQLTALQVDYSNYCMNNLDIPQIYDTSTQSNAGMVFCVYLNEYGSVSISSHQKSYAIYVIPMIQF